MFSHYLHGIPLLVPTRYNVIPFGHRCASAIACKYAGIRHMSLPFDWLNSGYPAKLQKVITNNFKDFVPDDYEDNKEHVMNKYDILLAHMNRNSKKGREAYRRRISRFQDIIVNDAYKMFICVYEDFLYNEMHRNVNYHEDIFQQIVDFESYYKETYGNDYVIIWIDFVKHNLPDNSRIVQVVVTPPMTYETADDSPYLEFRKYCGDVLKKMFIRE